MPRSGLSASATIPLPGQGGGAKEKPALKGLKVSPAAFKAKKGATVSFTLSEPGTVKFTIQRKAHGRKVGKTCKAPTPANAGGKRCVRYLAVKGSLAIDGKSGANSFPFKGKLGHKKLGPGAYLLTGQATDGSGSHSAPVAAAFRILE